MKDSILEKNSDYFYFAFRILVAVIFFLHGWMKFGNFMSGKLQLMSLMGLAMVLEIVIPILLIIGLCTRWVAAVGAIEMLVAFFKSHVPTDAGLVFNPLANRGEAAALFFVAFLALIAYGAGKWSIDDMKKKKK